MWWLMLIGLAVAVVVVMVGSKIRQFMRAMDSLGIDRMDLMKRVPDGSFIDYADKKYEEKAQLFKFSILRFLREREAATADEGEKTFWRKAAELFGNDKASWDFFQEVEGGVWQYLVFRLGWSKEKPETVFEITLSHCCSAGKSEERCIICDLPAQIIAEFDDLEFCDKTLS